MDKGLGGLHRFSHKLKDAKFIENPDAFWFQFLDPSYKSSQPAHKDKFVGDWLLESHPLEKNNLEFLLNRSQVDPLTGETHAIPKEDKMALLRQFDPFFRSEEFWDDIWAQFSRKCLNPSDTTIAHNISQFSHYWGHLYQISKQIVVHGKQYNGPASDVLSVRSETSGTIKFSNTYLNNAGLTSTDLLVDLNRGHFAREEKYIHPLPRTTQLKLDEGLDHIRRSLMQTREEFNAFLLHYRDLYLKKDIPYPDLRSPFQGWQPYSEFLPTLKHNFDKVEVHTVSLELMHGKMVTFNTRGRNEIEEILEIQDLLKVICSDIIDSEELHQSQVNKFGQVLDTTLVIAGESVLLTEMADGGEKLWDRSTKTFKDYGEPKNQDFETWFKEEMATIIRTPGSEETKIFKFYESSLKAEFIQSNHPISSKQNYRKVLEATATILQNYDFLQKSKIIPSKWSKLREEKQLTLFHITVRMLNSDKIVSLNGTTKPLYKHFKFSSKDEAQKAQIRWGISKIDKEKVEYRDNLEKWWMIHDNFMNLIKNPSKWLAMLFSWHNSKNVNRS